MLYEKSCGAVVWSKTDNAINILLLNHRNGGHWSFPKGHIENDETEIQTAHREILEETSLDLKIDDSFRFVNTYSPKKNVMKDVVFFSAFYEKGEVKAQESEVNEIKWFELSDAIKALTYQNDKNLLIEFSKFITK